MLGIRGRRHHLAGIRVTLVNGKQGQDGEGRKICGATQYEEESRQAMRGVTWHMSRNWNQAIKHYSVFLTAEFQRNTVFKTAI